MEVVKYGGMEVSPGRGVPVQQGVLELQVPMADTRAVTMVDARDELQRT